MDKDSVADSDTHREKQEQSHPCFFCLQGWVFLGSLDHDGAEVVESIHCRRCEGTGVIAQMPTLHELESWFTTELAAKALGRSHQGAINLARDGKVRGVKVARSHPGKGCWIFDPDSIKKFVEAERGTHG